MATVSCGWLQLFINKVRLTCFWSVPDPEWSTESANQTLHRTAPELSAYERTTNGKRGNRAGNHLKGFVVRGSGQRAVPVQWRSRASSIISRTMKNNHMHTLMFEQGQSHISYAGLVCVVRRTTPPKRGGIYFCTSGLGALHNSSHPALRPVSGRLVEVWSIHSLCFRVRGNWNECMWVWGREIGECSWRIFICVGWPFFLPRPWEGNVW